MMQHLSHSFFDLMEGPQYCTAFGFAPLIRFACVLITSPYFRALIFVTVYDWNDDLK